ncbi:MAG: Co2+/Mg2+ efflux protein ApaG [Alphaproteobacteria bacterium]|nr:Co2+/Mg2+ efflux protein ApaG [Alphaproteobacteria bacterium]
MDDETPYEALTEGVRVRVIPEYEEDQSEPDEAYYFWTYTVEISNEREAAVQLRSRVWKITNAHGQTEEVRGPGVVGQTPTIESGQSFSYTSGCPLSTASGIMVGSYQMADESGTLFDVEIPAFSLDSPFVTKSVN